MNDNIKIYNDGAKMAYDDCAEFLEGLFKNAPAEIPDGVKDSWLTIATSFRNKGQNIHKMSEDFLTGTRQ